MYCSLESLRACSMKLLGKLPVKIFDLQNILAECLLLQNVKLSSIKVDSRFTTTTQIVKLAGSQTISKIFVKIGDIKRTKMVGPFTVAIVTCNFIALYFPF